jgi:15-cis-phytoene synthase
VTDAVESGAGPAYHGVLGVPRHHSQPTPRIFITRFWYLPKRKREALSAVYAFMRRCDDIADDASLSLEERRIKLDHWLSALHRAQQGQPSDDPILLALTDAQRRYTIPAGLLDELAAGTAMDVVEQASKLRSTDAAAGPLTVQYKTFDDLKLYCYRVASVVGLVCIHIFGYRDPAAEPLAEQCGLAFQLTNIIRDVKEDAAMGRVYLPEEDLAKFGLSAADLLATPGRGPLPPACSRSKPIAPAKFYQAGDQLIPYISEDSQPALWVLVNIYRKLLEKIAERQYDVFSGKVTLTVSEKAAHPRERFPAAHHLTPPGEAIFPA